MRHEQKTIRVLAAPGMLIRYQTLSGAVAVRKKTDAASGDKRQIAVYISDEGLYDAAERKCFAPGPVVVADDQRHRRLVRDGDLVIVEEDKQRSRRAPRAPSAEDGE